MGQALAGGRTDHGVKPVQRMVAHIAVIQAEGEFVNIATKMLHANLVIDARQTALEHRPNALNSVHAGLLVNVLTDAMVHRLVLVEKPAKVGVNRRFIGVDGRTGFDVLIDRLVKIGRVGIGDVARSNPTAAFSLSGLL